MSQTILDDTQPGGPKERKIVYEAPFDRCDRERDYEIAWAHFEKRFGAGWESSSTLTGTAQKQQAEGPTDDLRGVFSKLGRVGIGWRMAKQGSQRERWGLEPGKPTGIFALLAPFGAVVARVPAASAPMVASV